MEVVFRTDASFDIGTGHVIRCLTLARRLREKGAKSRFVCRELAGNLLGLIEAQGFAVDALPQSQGHWDADHPPHARWLGVDWTVDARQSIEAIEARSSGSRPDWLVVDHYALDARWERLVRPCARHILAIDDLADRLHECDVLLDQNIGREPSDYSALVGSGCRLLTGPRHAMLRPEFAALRPTSLARRANAPVRSLLVSLGGIDRDNATGLVLDGLLHCDLPADLTITIVMGAQSPCLDAVREKAAQLPWFTRVAIDVNDMASIMADADIAIGAAGTTTWERCCLGLPSVVLGTAENQCYVLSQLSALDVAVVGEIARLRADPQELRELMQRLVSRRSEIARRAAALTEGNGADFLVHLLMTES